MTDPFRALLPRGRMSVGWAWASVVTVLAVGGCSMPTDPIDDGRRDSDSSTPPPTSPASGAPDRVVFATGAPAVAADIASVPDTADAVSSVVADRDWVAEVAASTLIPERALEAYAGAALTSGVEDPACGMSWNLLAGIGQVESRHGFIDGSGLNRDGLARPSIIGIPLDGSTVASVPDSDDGLLDGDTSVDRAVGPLQLIPESWRTWGIDADGDGVAEPQDIDDAALAAAHYLCRTGDLASEGSWRSAVLSWNRSEEYLEDVSTWAAFYGDSATR